MKKVITYGSYDMLHYGHIRLLERAKDLGDYLIVGVTSDDYDKTRGKINLQQTLMERVEAVKATGIPDEVIVEEYEGQKIDDIKRYGIDVFTVGSDWAGYFDYLKEYCDVVYLERTEGVSSSDIRAEKASLRLGLVGDAAFLEKVLNESEVVNGLNVVGICSGDSSILPERLQALPLVTSDLNTLLTHVDAVYIHSFPAAHYEQIKKSIVSGKHVLCESPMTLSKEQCLELFELADNNHVILMEAIRTAYATAYQRMLLLLKAGKIGKIVSVDSTCTSLRSITRSSESSIDQEWNSLSAWGPIGLLPIFQILGVDYKEKRIISHLSVKDTVDKFDLFSKIDFVYPDATASVKVGRGVKSEGELIISGTSGYIYVPAPWWRTDYFEVRYEDITNNRRYFYQLDGDGIRYELVAFSKAIQSGNYSMVIDRCITVGVASIMDDFQNMRDVVLI